MADNAHSEVASEIARHAPLLPVGRLDELLRAVTSADRVFVCAVGRCGLVLKMFATRLAQLGIRCYVVGDLTTPSIGDGDVLIAASGSGVTPTVVLLASRARMFGVKVIGLSAHEDAEFARNVDSVITLPVPAKTDPIDRKQSVQPPGSLFEQLLLCFLEEAILRLARQQDEGFQTIRSRHANLE